MLRDVITFALRHLGQSRTAFHERVVSVFIKSDRSRIRIYCIYSVLNVLLPCFFGFFSGFVIISVKVKRHEVLLT